MIRRRLRIPRVARCGLTSTPPLASRSLPFAQSIIQAQAAQSRSLGYHYVPKLIHDFEKTGVPDFLSAEGYDIAWKQYQTLMIEKLEEKTAETQWANKELLNVVLHTAREPRDAAIFNYASMAHNNHFFFKGLSPTTVEIPHQLKADLERSFGSIETLRREMVYTADAMFGPGFVWLVQVRQSGMNAFKILTTYLAGTPYAAAHFRRQNLDANTDIGGNSQKGITAGHKYLENSANAAGKRSEEASKESKIAPGGIDVHPVLCLNTWEHVWLRDFGMGVGGMGGKLEYAEAWWYRIDWNVVAEMANKNKATLYK
ncbi:Manganese/iron superoxide dismutase [Apodospora peruviana]|uniref:Manganese/iron superoxide dismutase n=1 Tax=Apodospora peruviana TaxID=516989 RepID=A0AAE0IRE1_9PEZI|nr:Manganese/iron superoxide dismutase [Apodospora peruviana]